ncbi:metallophosphoesterase [Sphaerotilus sulfidivorans]|nr:metallophosphoesterase [Sphaerotilus sulfidivorans]NZD45548.1 metallophosphoesterase [Sphaerotilus sulfidivorans]
MRRWADALELNRAQPAPHCHPFCTNHGDGTMSDRRTLRILHLSDLHIGKERTSGWRMRRVLGEAWTRNLHDIAADGPVDLVCFTGDLAQSGQAAQYEEASRFVDEVLRVLKVPKARFFCVPGNHDVDRTIASDAWREMRDGAWEVSPQAYARWLAGGRAPRGFDAAWPDALLRRQAAYRDWLDAAGLSAQRPEHGPHGRFGYRISLDDLGLEAPLHVVGLDSAWLAGDDDDAGKLRLTDEQVVRLLTDERGERLPGWTIALVHHPLSDLADGREAQRLLSEFGVSLLLHGHLHDAEVSRWTTPAASLHVSAAGSLYETDQFPNGVQLLDVQLPKGRPIEPRHLWARCWSGRSGRGHWHNDDGLYPGSVGGKLRLVPPDPPDHPFTPGKFIGRDDELAKLQRALLPEDGSTRHPTVLCCAIEGMAGVGKTRLAEHFIAEHWLPALGLPEDTDPATVCQRLILDPQALEPPTALGLGRTLTDRLRAHGPDEGLWDRLKAALSMGGPQGGPWLLLIENVDAAAQAQAVGELVNRLPGVPILVTARYQKLGSTGWTRVPVAPMSAHDARKLLLAEVEPDGHPLTDAEADDLAQRLGRLPLALHIAASHLSLGLTPQAFLDELRRAGLDLPPAEPGDPRLSADRARAVVRSSFELSWRHWCAGGPGADPAWQQALVALAHGPANPTGLSLSAAITAIDEALYPVFAVAAARLSLLQYQPAARMTQLHPLIAEFLRQQPEPTEATVTERLGGWFLPLLPETGDERQRDAWARVEQEVESLAHWLAAVPVEQGPAVERAAKDYATTRGPYALWQQFCERLIASHDDPAILSNVLWTQAQVLERGGQLSAAQDAARRKADLDQARGEEHGAALALGQIADVLQARGELEEALRIRREEALPVYEKLGDVRERAVTMGKIADVLQARGELEEALRIRREEELPVYEKLGDVRSRAVTMGKIADVLQARGELEEALRIRREEALPVYEKLGDVRSLLVGRTNLAICLAMRGQIEDAPEMIDLLRRAFGAARRLGLPEAKQIADVFEQIFGVEIPEV